MALLIPSTAGMLRHDGGVYRELDLVNGLAASLPDGYEVFHGITLHSVRDGRDHYGEIDVVVMAPSGALLLMEVKAGEVVLRDGTIYKMYSDGQHDVGRQCRLQRTSLLGRLHDARLDTSVVNCLVLPDYLLTEQQAVSVPRERIIDAARYPQVCGLVREWLAGCKGCTQLDALRQFLHNQFRVTADLAAMRDQLERTTRIMSDGLATWVPRIAAPSAVLRIQATAGSGKTQLALRLLDMALAEGRSAAYICFNRTLGDYIRARAPVRAQVANFHELAVEHFRRTVGEPDFTDPAVLEHAAVRYVEDSVGFAARFDLLVIDEAQDFEPAWIQGVCQLLRADGGLYLLEDDDQRLYHRDDFDTSGATVVRSRDNYRSPRLVCDVINALRLCHPAVNSLSPYKGQLPGLHPYATTAELVAQIERAVTGLLERGFTLADIVIISNLGRASSALTGLDCLGPWTTRRFTGKYDRNGEPVWTDGELMIESVYRYKGQSAPAVVLAEVAFDALTAHEKKKLFVGLTRAQMAVELVLTAAAEQTLVGALYEGADH